MSEPDLFAAARPAPTDGAWSVTDVTRRARYLVEAGFERLWVRGEVTGFKRYQSGHWYFTLRDAQAQVRCVMWRSENQNVTEPEEGLQVFVESHPTVWEERGEFRLTVKQLLPTDAAGLWQIRLQRARANLERDGLLDPARKRPLPRFPLRIGVVTSTDGAALGDIVSVLRRRWPVASVLVIPARVQGEGAAGDLLQALALVNRVPGLDVVIVGRGGGSREDLWAFNNERVARAVAAVRVPTVSAVGHETDVSLTDLVADLRAPTPSAAAEAVVPDRDAVHEVVNGMARRVAHGLRRRADLGRERLGRTADRLESVLGAHLQRRSTRLAHLASQLDALSPLRILQRGYAVARDDGDLVLKQIRQFRPGLGFRLTVSDGEVRATAGPGS